MNPYFSVVIPLYNKKPHILRSVYSVLGQEFKDFELIVVDDGSTDGSIDELFNINDNRLKIISKENGGVSSARNRGIEESSGEYVAFLDADDEWESNHLENIVSLIKKFPKIGLYSSSYINVKADIKVENVIQNNKMFIMTDYFKQNAPSNSSTAVVKKSIFKELSFKEDMFNFEDHYVFYSIALKYKVAYSLDPTVKIYKDSVNRTVIKPINLYNQFKLMCSYIDLFIQKNREFIDIEQINNLNDLLNNKSIIIAKNLIKNKNFYYAKVVTCSRKYNKINCFLFGYLARFVYLAYKFRDLLKRNS